MVGRYPNYILLIPAASGQLFRDVGSGRYTHYRRANSSVTGAVQRRKDSRPDPPKRQSLNAGDTSTDSALPQAAAIGVLPLGVKVVATRDQGIAQSGLRAPVLDREVQGQRETIGWVSKTE